MYSNSNKFPLISKQVQFSAVRKVVGKTGYKYLPIFCAYNCQYVSIFDSLFTPESLANTKQQTHITIVNSCPAVWSHSEQTHTHMLNAFLSRACSPLRWLLLCVECVRSSVV